MPSPTPIHSFSDITEDHAKEVLNLLSYGLSRGLGQPEPGKMCVEAVISHVLGLGHHANPHCVGVEVKKFKIELNDNPNWSSNQARAEGMKEIALAQLGSDQLDQKEFKDLLWFRLGTQIQPIIARAVKGKTGKIEHEKYAELMERSKSLKECIAHAQAHVQAQAQAHDCGFDYVLDYAFAYGYNYAHAYGFAYGYAYGYDYAYGYLTTPLLYTIAQVGLSVLKDLNSPGCKFLHLINPSANE